MERLKTLRTVVYLTCAIMAVQFAILVLTLKPSGVFLITGFSVVAVLFIYVARIALMAINELIDKHK